MNKLKFNIFDTIIIILIIASFFGSAFYTYSRQISMMFVKNNDAVITLTMQSSEKCSASSLSDNGIIYLSDKETKLGKILTVVNRRNSEEISNEDGSIINTYSDNSFTVIIRIDTKVKETKNGKYINSSTFIAPGKVIGIDTKKGTVNCSVDKIIIK